MMLLRSIFCKRVRSCPLALRESAPFRAGRLRVLGHAARDEAPDRDLIVKPHRPNHRASRPVRFGDYGVVGNIDPVILQANPTMAALRFPVAVRGRAAGLPAEVYSLLATERLSTSPCNRRVWLGASRHRCPTAFFNEPALVRCISCLLHFGQVR